MSFTFCLSKNCLMLYSLFFFTLLSSTEPWTSKKRPCLAPVLVTISLRRLKHDLIKGCLYCIECVSRSLCIASLLVRPCNDVGRERERGGGHSTEIVFALLTQPRVRIPARPRFFLSLLVSLWKYREIEPI